MSEEIGSPKVKAPADPVKKGDVVEIKTALKHPMESGMRKDKDGAAIAAHHVDQFTVEYGGKPVLKAAWSGAIAKNPFFSFKMKAAAAGPVKVTWKDNKEQAFDATAELKVQ